MRRLAASLGALALVASATVILSTAAGAAIITVGPNLGGATVSGHVVCEHPGKAGTVSACLFAQDMPSYESPVSGAIVAWRVKGATGNLALRVLHGDTGLSGSCERHHSNGTILIASSNEPRSSDSASWAMATRLSRSQSSSTFPS